MKFLLSAALKWPLLLAIILFCGGFSAKHPFYVTVIELNHNAREKSLEISCKLFADDLETTLKKQYKVALDITHPKDPKALDKMVTDYCSKHFKVKLDGRQVTLEYVGFEKESESAWCYFQVSNIASIRKMELTNDFLYELYDSQISIMHASVGGVRKSVKIDYPATQASFSW